MRHQLIDAGDLAEPRTTVTGVDRVPIVAEELDETSKRWARQ